MALGGTRPAGVVFQKSNKNNRLTLCPKLDTNSTGQVKNKPRT